MSTNEVEQLLNEVGAELGRSPAQMAPIVQKLVVEEWFDTIASLRTLSDDQWSKLALPVRLVERLKQRINDVDLPPALTPIQPPPVRQIDVTTRVEAAPEDLSASVSIPVSILIDSIRDEIESVCQHDDDEDSDDPTVLFVECLQTLITVIGNILTDPHSVKFRQLKLANPKFQQNVGRWTSAIGLLRATGFEQVAGEDLLRCEVVYLSRFTDMHHAIGSAIAETGMGTKPAIPISAGAFNPFKSSITNAGDTFGAPKGRVMEEREAELDQLRRDATKSDQSRFSAGRSMPKPRLVRLDGRISQANIPDDDEDPSLLLSNLRSIAAASADSQKFKSRERLELERLRARPVFTSTTVRVAFADKCALELVLSPSESVQGLYGAVAGCLREGLNEWVLTVSPPMRRLDRKSTRTMSEEDFVPSVTVRMMMNGQQCVSTQVLGTNFI